MPEPHPPRRHKVFLGATIFFLAAWIAFLAWMALHH
jgi:hypothetical protein